MKKAFTMVELVFAIVIVGILSAIAIPKFVATRDDAIISKGRATVAALRSAIAMERQKRILRNDFSDINGTAAKSLLDCGMDENRWSLNGDTFTLTAPNGNTCAFSVTNNKLIKGTCSVASMSDL